MGNWSTSEKIMKNTGFISKNVEFITKNVESVGKKNIFAEEECEKNWWPDHKKWGFLPMGAENHRYIGVSSTLEPSHTFPRYLLHPMNPSPKWKFGLKTCLTTPLCMMTWGFVLEKVAPIGRVSMCSRAAFFRPRLVCFGPFGARARCFSKPKVHFGRRVFG